MNLDDPRPNRDDVCPICGIPYKFVGTRWRTAVRQCNCFNDYMDEIIYQMALAFRIPHSLLQEGHEDK